MKYRTNNQNEFENLATLYLSAFDKWVSQKSNLPNNVDINIKGCQKISSMICFLSSKQKIATLMARLYLLWGDPFYEFQEFVMLFIKYLLYKFDECKYCGGFICKINKWICGYLHTHYTLFMPSRFIGTLLLLWVHLNL
jgi:hypothetical protein